METMDRILREDNSRQTVWFLRRLMMDDQFNKLCLENNRVNTKKRWMGQLQTYLDVKK